MLKKITLILSHLLAVTFGILGVGMFDRTKLQSTIPSCLLGNGDEYRTVALAAGGRFLLVAAEPRGGLGLHKQYWLWDRVAGETLASFGEALAARPLMSRTLYYPGSALPATMVADIRLNATNDQVSGVSLSSGCLGGPGHGKAEVVYDTNLDGFLDKMQSSAALPYAGFVRVSPTLWAPARESDGGLEAMIDGEWVGVQLPKTGFWEAKIAASDQRVGARPPAETSRQKS